MKDRSKQPKETFSLDELFLYNDKGLSVAKGNLFTTSVNHKTALPFLQHPFQRKYLEIDTSLLTKEEKTHFHNFKAAGNIGIVVEDLEQNPLKNYAAFITDTIVSATHFKRNPTIIYPLFYKRGSKSELNLNKEVLSTISKKLFLEFLPLSPQSGNVCYAESPEVRDEFKTHFTAEHLIDYLYAQLFSNQSKKNSTSSEKKLLISYPEEHSFWRFVRLGKKLRTLHLKNTSSSKPFVQLSHQSTRNPIETIRPLFPQNEIWINNQQYFHPISEKIWNFSIGSSTPAQNELTEWLGKELSESMIEQYKETITRISQTLLIIRKLHLVI